MRAHKTAPAIFLLSQTLSQLKLSHIATGEAMPRYTSTQVISFGPLQESRILIVNGELTINAFDGVDYILSDTLQTGTKEIFTKNMTLQFVPSAGSSFFLGEE